MNYRALVNLTLLLTFALILVGGATRVFEAGVSCPDWPQCYGLWWPWPESRVYAVNHLGYVVATPFAGIRHFAAYQVALEWGHRLLVGLVSAGIAVLVLGAAPSGQPKTVWAPLTALILLFIVQNQPRRHHRLARQHQLERRAAPRHSDGGLRQHGLAAPHRSRWACAPQPVPLARGWETNYPLLAMAFGASVWATMVVGGVVSSSHAGGVCGGLLSCAGQWFPTDVSQRWHMLHRLLALTTFSLSIALLVCARKASLTAVAEPGFPHLPHVARHLHFMVLGQLALGILTLYSFASYPQFYPLLSLCHLAWGTLVWLGALGQLLTLMYGPVGRFHALTDDEDLIALTIPAISKKPKRR